MQLVEQLVRTMWEVALEQEDRPSFLSLTRQGLPSLKRDGPDGAEALRRGAYTLLEASNGTPKVILIASGSELHLAVEARETLEEEGVPTRVVSMPSWRLFLGQDQGYRDSVLPPEIPARVSVEAGTTLGWTLWIGSEGTAVGLDHFGASAPWQVLFREYGITSERTVDEARRLLSR